MGTLSTEFGNSTGSIGPYKVAPYNLPVLSKTQFSALSNETRERIISDRQSIILFSAAIEDSYLDKELGNLEIQFHGSRHSLQQLIDEGKGLPSKERLLLVKDIVNENMAYSPPEDDAKVKRRQNAPMQNVIDYAQTSRESLESKHGDCEDFAILAADLLQKMGTPPEDIKILAGSVYNRDGHHQFDHANLTVKTSEKSWDTLELINDSVTILGTTSYLQHGLKGELFFVPSIAVGADLAISDFNIDQSKDLPKSRFEKPFKVPANLEQTHSPSITP